MRNGLAFCVVNGGLSCVLHANNPFSVWITLPADQSGGREKRKDKIHNEEPVRKDRTSQSVRSMFSLPKIS